MQTDFEQQLRDLEALVVNWHVSNPHSGWETDEVSALTMAAVAIRRGETGNDPLSTAFPLSCGVPNLEFVWEDDMDSGFLRGHGVNDPDDAAWLGGMCDGHTILFR